MTKYKDIASDIRDKIIAGDWFYGMKIPSQRQLAIQYNVNRVTIIKSIESSTLNWTNSMRIDIVNLRK